MRGRPGRGAAVLGAVTARVPGSGWHQVSSDEGGVRLRSGKATVHVTRFSDGTWAVDSGTTC